MYNILTDYNNPMPGEGPFYTDYLWKAQEAYPEMIGIEYIDWDTANYIYLNKHKDEIVKVFNQYYKYRELGSETEYRFQDMLQSRFYEVADKYDHAYKVTEINDVDKIGTGYTFEETKHRDYTSTADTNGTENRDNKYKDTPSSTASTTNNPTNQTIDNRDNTGHAEGTETQDETLHQEKVSHDKEMILELNDLIDKYKQLVIEFVKEFEICFIGLYGNDALW